MKTDVYDRFKDYDKDHCWQYQIKLEELKHLQRGGQWSNEFIESFKIKDFELIYIDKTEKKKCLEVKDFIETYEWLGRLPVMPTHRFIAKHTKTGLIGSVVVMATPNAFSHILGKENKDLEKLISRGASSSWAPKNLGSWTIMKSIKWMVKNTQFRVFSAYSDPEAKELGTIYQACGFYYLGQKNGTTRQYFDHDHPERGWFSDREFRKSSKYKKYARNIGISEKEWKSYMGKWSPDWSKIPADLKEKLKLEERKYRDSCEVRKVLPKHKYVYILGKDKKETRELRKLFDNLNPIVAKSKFDYPKNRGF